MQHRLGQARALDLDGIDLGTAVDEVRQMVREQPLGADIGLRIFKVGMVWPLEASGTHEELLAQGRASVRRTTDALGTAQRWREKAAAEGLSIRDLVIEVTGRQSFVGSPLTVASQLNHFVQHDACDGFILVPHLTPGGLDPFVDRVVPLLQEIGVLRTEYAGAAPTEIETQAEYAESRRVGSVLGKVSSASRISTWLSRSMAARSSRPRVSA